jgi:hypothetical protein
MKTQRMSIKEFMNNEKPYSRKKSIVKFGAALPLAVLPMTTISAQAATTESVAVATMSPDEIYDKVQTAFEPVNVLIQSLAYPLAGIVVLFGTILVIISQKEKGLQLMSNAGLGVILVNLMPMLFDVLAQIMKAF